MKTLVYLPVALILILSSCGPKNHKILPDQKTSFIGKWYRFSFSNGYSEFDIDSTYVVFYNQKTGRFKFEYKIDNDSFKYISHKYAAKFIDYSDSICLQGNDNTTATLYRFKEPSIPFNAIPEETDSVLFNSYLEGFNQRMIHAYEKAGFQFFDNPNEENDTSNIYEQLLNNKNP
jgi:hypothetical protein